MEVLRTVKLSKIYGSGETRVEALREASLSISKGEFVSIVGPSGSGKSTLLHLLGALDTPTSGKVYMEGKDLFAMKEKELSIFRRRHIGFIFQSYNLVPELNVEENIVLPILLDYRKPDWNYVKELLDILGLRDRRHHLPNQLSGGQQQRVAIGRALITKPAVILADEPTGNLDSKNSKEVVNLMKMSVERYKQTLVMITHNENYASYADRVFSVEDGKVTELGGGGTLKSYLSIVSRYLYQHKKKTRLAIISVAISVTLITGIFSMLDALMRFEKLQVMHDYGNYHLAVLNATDEERNAIASRIDVRNSGRWKSIGKGVINGVTCQFGAVDSNFAKNINMNIIEGSYPEKINEIMLEQWAMERISSELAIGSSVLIKISEGIEREVVISGVYNDFGNMKASGVPGVLVSFDLALEAEPYKNGEYLVEFKDGVNVLKSEKEIKSTLGIEDERVVHNEHLLAVIGQSEHKAAVGIYTIGVILFIIVLAAGVVMIYNTFNISVMERIRQFGLLRCVGASRSQIERMVRREGLFITLVAIPIGLAAGMLMTFVCSAILKFFNSSIFGIMPLFTFSILGIGAGIATAFLTVFIASLLPAKKAGRVSPLNAVTGSSNVRISKDRKKGLLTKVLHVDIAIGINSALVKKKTLALMSCSIAISIVMFLGFQVLVEFLHSSLKTTKPYTPDVSLVSEQGLDNVLYKKVSSLEGVKKAYGRMFGYANVTFDAERLTEEYKTEMGGIEVRDDGMFDPPEQSWLISYDKNQLNWAKADLLYGKLDEELMNEKNGVVAVHTTLRKGVTSRTASFKLGDRVYVDTPEGTKTLTVMAILRSLPFSDSKLNLTTFIVTEKQFTELTGDDALRVIDIQLKGKNQEQTIKEIKSIAGDGADFLDSRQKNDEMDKTFMTMAVFIYGFVIVIALISLLNIVNTMNTSVAAKTRYYGVMRAVGMTGGQLDRMVLAEAAAYSLIGCVAGCVLGILLQRALINNFMTHFKMVWKFPLTEVILIFVLSLLVTAISVKGPLKRIKARGIADVVNSL